MLYFITTACQLFKMIIGSTNGSPRTQKKLSGREYKIESNFKIIQWLFKLRLHRSLSVSEAMPCERGKGCENVFLIHDFHKGKAVIKVGFTM